MEKSMLSQIMQLYNETMETADPRASEYPLMDRPGCNMFFILLYVFLVTYAGPKYMKNRPAYNLRKWMIGYNVVMILLSGYIFYEFLVAGWLTGYSLLCQECDYSYSEKALRMLRVSYLYWFSKYIEFLDTFFFVAHKKFSHVSFLHVIHHSLMVFTWWLGVKFGGGGLGTFHGMLNAFVHVVMYTYYAISALGPAYQKYIWWKKHLTAFQMIQFAVSLGHIGNIIVFHNCNYPLFLQYLIAFSSALFLALFSNFWIQAYNKQAFPEKKELEPKYLSDISINNTTSSTEVRKRSIANNNSK